MRPARILLLLVAIIAGGLAAFLATRGSAPPPVVEQAAAPAPVAPAAQVLVAKAPIGVGQRLTPGDVEWQAWPDNAVRAEYITSAKSPDANTKIVGTVARFEIFQGEPILDAKLAHADQGFLSAVLQPGMRGVSVDIAAASGSGGFIIPNDRVDVILTDTSQGQATSRILLSNVKVLAIGTRLGQTGTTGAPPDPADPKSQIFTNSAIATLELNPGQADTLINATSLGKISLVLRSVADFAQTASSSTTPTVAAPDDNQSVKVIRFGRAQSVTPGSGQQQGQAEVNTAAYTAPTVVPSAPVVATPVPTVTTTTVTPAAPTVTTTTSTPSSTAPVFVPGGSTPATPPAVD